MIFRSQKNSSESDRPRRIISDVKPPYGKLPLAQHKRPSIISQIPAKKPEARYIENRDIRPGRSFHFPGKKYAYGIFSLLVLFGIGAYIVWSSTLTLAIQPNKTEFTLNSPGMRVSLPAEEFSKMLEKKAEGESRQTGTYNTRASGTVIVFNNFSVTPQVLSETTRFRTPEGLIFRSKDRVTIPGKTGDKPGLVDVMVVADAAGETYNIGLTDFTIPGFVGTPKFEKIFARSKTEMKGGASGNGKIVGEAEAGELLTKVEGDMYTELKNDFEASIPEDYVVFPKKFEYVTQLKVTDPPMGSPAERFFAAVRGEARTLGIRKNAYSDALAKELFKDRYREGAYTLTDRSKLTFTTIDFDYDRKIINVVVEGTAYFEWTFDQSELQKRVLEADGPDALDEIFKSYPGIKKVEMTFRPGFLKRIPKNPSRLIVQVKR